MAKVEINRTHAGVRGGTNILRYSDRSGARTLYSPFARNTLWPNWNVLPT